MRLFILPHTLVGIGLVGAVLVMALASLFGTETTGYVTRTRTGSSKGHTTYTVEYRYDGATPGLTDSSSVSAAVYGSLQRAKGAPAAEVQVSHFELGPIQISRLPEEQTASGALGFLSLFAVGWNSMLGIFLWQLGVVPHRHKQLIKLGTPTPGQVTSKRTTRGKSTRYYVSYAYETARGERLEKEMSTRGELWARVEEGATVTVLYRPDKPALSVVYELGTYEVDASGR
jgi:hypothetical protein